jgi:hypothetical protein
MQLNPKQPEKTDEWDQRDEDPRLLTASIANASNAHCQAQADGGNRKTV